MLAIHDHLKIAMRGGGPADEEARGLYEEAIQLHNKELCPLSNKVETLVLETVQAKNRQDLAIQISNIGRLKVSCMS